ncbi:MAG: HypC/HybG/HupF family hydrogenase formation chaperone [Prochlorotrichaceae cyanobacterium]|jgi:hydrogenase expression/formation protein HypC
MCLAIPGKIISISDRPLDQKRSSSELTEQLPHPLLDPSTLGRTGKVSFGGVLKDISLAYVPEAKVDDYVIVHVGFALSILDQTEAEQTLSYIAQMQLSS